jgi:adenosine deaminase
LTETLTLSARSHILIRILKDYCKDFGVLSTIIFLLKIFERFEKKILIISFYKIYEGYEIKFFTKL